MIYNSMFLCRQDEFECVLYIVSDIDIKMPYSIHST